MLIRATGNRIPAPVAGNQCVISGCRAVHANRLCELHEGMLSPDLVASILDLSRRPASVWSVPELEQFIKLTGAANLWFRVHRPTEAEGLARMAERPEQDEYERAAQ